MRCQLHYDFEDENEMSAFLDRANRGLCAEEADNLIRNRIKYGTNVPDKERAFLEELRQVLNDV
jgi:hypothetical protein